MTTEVAEKKAPRKPSAKNAVVAVDVSPEDAAANTIARKVDIQPTSPVKTVVVDEVQADVQLPVEQLPEIEAEVHRDTLILLLKTAKHAIATKSTLPVLSHYLITFSPDGVEVASTDLAMGVRIAGAARSLVPGALCVPNGILGLISSFPPDVIHMKVDQQTATLNLQCGPFDVDVNGIEADEFPILPEASELTDIAEFDVAQFTEGVDRVVFSAARDDTRPVLTGVLFQVREEKTTLASADGFRLGRQHLRQLQTFVDMADVAKRDIIVPAETLMKVSKMIDGAGTVVRMSLSKTGGQVFFTVGSVTIASRLIEGKFPDYERIIPHPESIKRRLVMRRDELLNALRVAAFYASASANVINLVFDDKGVFSVGASAGGVGKGIVQVSTMAEGEPGKTGANVKFLDEALKALPTDSVALSWANDKTPIQIEGVGLESFLHILMPMTVR